MTKKLICFILSFCILFSMTSIQSFAADEDVPVQQEATADVSEKPAAESAQEPSAKPSEPAEEPAAEPTQEPTAKPGEPAAESGQEPTEKSGEPAADPAQGSTAKSGEPAADQTQGPTAKSGESAAEPDEEPEEETLIPDATVPFGLNRAPAAAGLNPGGVQPKGENLIEFAYLYFDYVWNDQTLYTLDVALQAGFSLTSDYITTFVSGGFSSDLGGSKLSGYTVRSVTRDGSPVSSFNMPSGEVRITVSLAKQITVRPTAQEIAWTGSDVSGQINRAAYSSSTGSSVPGVYIGLSGTSSAVDPGKYNLVAKTDETFNSNLYDLSAPSVQALTVYIDGATVKASDQELKRTGSNLHSQISRTAYTVNGRSVTIAGAYVDTNPSGREITASSKYELCVVHDSVDTDVYRNLIYETGTLTVYEDDIYLTANNLELEVGYTQTTSSRDYSNTAFPGGWLTAVHVIIPQGLDPGYHRGVLTFNVSVGDILPISKGYYRIGGVTPGDLTVYQEISSVEISDQYLLGNGENRANDIDSKAYTVNGGETLDIGINVQVEGGNATSIGGYRLIANRQQVPRWYKFNNTTWTYGTLYIGFPPDTITIRDQECEVGNVNLSQYDYSVWFQPNRAFYDGVRDHSKPKIKLVCTEDTSTPGRYTITADLSNMTALELGTHPIKEIIPGTLTVYQNISVTASDAEVDINKQDAFTGSYSVSANIATDGVTVTADRQTVPGVYAGAINTSVKVGDSFQDNLYRVTEVNPGTLTVFASGISVKAEDQSFEYGNGAFDPEKFTISGYDGEIPGLKLSLDREITGPGKYPIKVDTSNVDSTLYRIASTTAGTLTVYQNISVTASDAEVDINAQDDFTGSYTVSPEVDLDGVTVTADKQTVPGVYEGTINTNVKVGDSFDDNVYRVTEVNPGTLTVFASGISVKAEDQSFEYGNGAFDPEKFTISGYDGEIPGLKLSLDREITGPGEYVINVDTSEADANLYRISSVVPGKLTIYEVADAVVDTKTGTAGTGTDSGSDERVEERRQINTAQKAPETGDNQMTILYLLLLLGSGGAIAYILRRSRGKRRNT